MFSCWERTEAHKDRQRRPKVHNLVKEYSQLTSTELSEAIAGLKAAEAQASKTPSLADFLLNFTWFLIYVLFIAPKLIEKFPDIPLLVTGMLLIAAGGVLLFIFISGNRLYEIVLRLESAKLAAQKEDTATLE